MFGSSDEMFEIGTLYDLGRAMVCDNENNYLSSVRLIQSLGPVTAENMDDYAKNIKAMFPQSAAPRDTLFAGRDSEFNEGGSLKALATLHMASPDFKKI